MTRFTLTFDDLSDPAPEDVSMIRGRLAGATMEQVTPGVLSISGAEESIRAALGNLPKWRLQREVRFTSPSPHRTRLKRASA
jgi:hypothetical protein